jgi:hypothetical protein
LMVFSVFKITKRRKAPKLTPLWPCISWLVSRCLQTFRHCLSPNLQHWRRAGARKRFNPQPDRFMDVCGIGGGGDGFGQCFCSLTGYIIIIIIITIIKSVIPSKNIGCLWVLSTSVHRLLRTSFISAYTTFLDYRSSPAISRSSSLPVSLRVPK